MGAAGIRLPRRRLLTSLALLPVAARARAPWDAVVRPGESLAAALDRARAANGAPFRILLRRGRHSEQVRLDVPNVTLAGEGPDTILTFAAAHGLRRPDGTEYGTRGSATLAVTAPGVTLRDLTIRNGFDYLAAKRADDGMGAQAVALRIDRGAERTRVDRCTLEGWQDTLYVQATSHIADCRILGGTDFIFGGGAAWFERCRIVTRFVPGAENQGYIAAPSTPAAQRYGLVFADCRLEREARVPDRSAWLGRPWRAGGDMSITGEAAYLRCWMDAHIRREGWTWMGYRGPKGEPHRLTPQQARLYEYASTGPGAAPAAPTRRLLTATEAAAYTRSKILGGWPVSR